MAYRCTPVHYFGSLARSKIISGSWPVPNLNALTAAPRPGTRIAGFQARSLTTQSGKGGNGTV